MTNICVKRTAAIDYFKEISRQDDSRNSSKRIIVTDGVSSRIAPKENDFFPEGNELIFEIRRRARTIRVKRLTWITKEVYDNKKEKENTKKRRIL